MEIDVEKARERGTKGAGREGSNKWMGHSHRTQQNQAQSRCIGLGW